MSPAFPAPQVHAADEPGGAVILSLHLRAALAPGAHPDHWSTTLQPTQRQWMSEHSCCFECSSRLVNVTGVCYLLDGLHCRRSCSSLVRASTDQLCCASAGGKAFEHDGGAGDRQAAQEPVAQQALPHLRRCAHACAQDTAELCAGCHMSEGCVSRCRGVRVCCFESRAEELVQLWLLSMRSSGNPGMES